MPYTENVRWPHRDRIAIVASGPSLAAIDPAAFDVPGLTTIAVNGAIEWLRRADYWFTLDESAVNLIRANNPRFGTQYVMAVPARVSTPPHVVRIVRHQGRLFGKARAVGHLCECHNGVATGNSAFGALGLAYHMRPEKIAIFGVDGTQEPRVTGGRPRTLAHLPALFKTAVPQLRAAGIDVVNGSPNSAVDCWPRMTPQEALSCLLN